MLMQPSPIAETSRLLVPSLLFFIFVGFGGEVDGREIDRLIGWFRFGIGHSTSPILLFSDSVFGPLMHGAR
jgi:hypothetical protein